MKYIIILICLLLVSCGPSPEEKRAFFDSCSKKKDYHECVYLWTAMNSGCEAEKAQSAAMVGGMIGASLSSGSRSK